MKLCYGNIGADDRALYYYACIMGMSRFIVQSYGKTSVFTRIKEKFL